MLQFRRSSKEYEEMLAKTLEYAAWRLAKAERHGIVLAVIVFAEFRAP
jgi:hypothetical protein